MSNRRLPLPFLPVRLGRLIHPCLVVVVVLLLSTALTTAFQLSPPILHHGRTHRITSATSARGDTTAATMRSIPSNPKLTPQQVILPVLQASTTVGPTKQDFLQNKRFVGKFKTLIHRGISSLASTVLRTNRLLLLQQRLSRLRRRIVLAAALCCLLLSPVNAAAAVTGGRVGGGNFRSSPAPRVRSAPSSSRGSSFGGGIRGMHHSNYYRPQQYHHYRPSSTTIIPIFLPSRNTHRHVVVDNNNDNRLVVANHRKNPVADLVVVAGTVAAVAYVAKKSANGDEAAVTKNNIHVGSLTVTFSLPNNNNKNDRYQQQQQPSLLEQIKRIAGTADTVDGVGELVSDVCLELLRNMDRIECAYGEQDATPYKSMEAAEQAYRRKSVLMQSKFDRFVVNKFGTKDKAAASVPLATFGGSDDGESSRPTLGLVTIQYATERAMQHTGTKLLTRDDLRSALSELASCRPNAAEVIWAPGMADEVLDAPTVYSLFPQLVPI
jgi:uncharacterized membrane protein